jgi:hypothetical protein
VAVQAGGCASSECDVESDGEWDYPKSVGHVRFAGQRSGHGEGCWVELGPCMGIRNHKKKPTKKNLHGRPE